MTAAIACPGAWNPQPASQLPHVRCPCLCAQVKGYVYATMMLLGLVIGSLCDNQHFQRVVRAGFRLRGVLTHEVFRKVCAAHLSLSFPTLQHDHT